MLFVVRLDGVIWLDGVLFLGARVWDEGGV